MANITQVDFVNKRVRHFKEEPKISKKEVCNAVELLREFLNEDYNQKVEETSAAEQVLLHEIEAANEDVLRDNAEEIVMNIKDIRNTRRDAKDNQKVKEQIEKKLTKMKVDNLYQTLVGNPKKEGSSEKYFNGKLKRTNASKEYLERALLKNMAGQK